MTGVTPNPPPAPVATHPGQLAGFDGMRAIAAVGVLLFHALWRTPALRPAGRLLGHGDIGVEIFFVMSGFLVARPLVRHIVLGGKPVAFGDFWRKRVARIWPAYLVALVGAVVIGIAEVDGVAGGLKHGLLVQTYFADRGGTGLKVSWTLVVEVSFYAVLLPLGAMVARVRTRPHDAWVALCLVLFAVGAVALVVTTNGPTATPLRVLPPYLPCFAAGMLLAGAEVGAPPGARSAPLLSGVRRLAAAPKACFALAVGMFVAMVVLLPASSTAPAFGAGTDRTIQSFGQVLVAFVALAPLALGTTRARWLEHRVLVAIGAASFGFYLWHVQVLRLVRPMLQGSDATAYAGVLVAIVGAYLAGAGSRRFIEEPARKLLTRRRSS
jgi:peptidoglycan/LPS O-acetylase OafA/YrhL